jgi:hypothetical protein
VIVDDSHYIHVKNEYASIVIGRVHLKNSEKNSLSRYNSRTSACETTEARSQPYDLSYAYVDRPYRD